MESLFGLSSVLRSMRLEGLCDVASPPKSGESPSRRRPRPRPEDDDDGWVSAAVAAVRVVACFVTMMVTTFAWAVVMLFLLPWPYQRIRQGNLYGHVTGKLLMWILGNPIKIEGTEYANTRAIYICNHASPLDIFLIMWLTPTGTVGIAKKEIIFYPLFGQLYALANHLRIDRSNPAAAIKSIKEGFVHIALQTRLLIVPMIITGTHRAWRKGSLQVRPTPLSVKYLPPIQTNEWEAKKIGQYVDMIHALYVGHLPEAQKPLQLESRDTTKCSES